MLLLFPTKVIPPPYAQGTSCTWVVYDHRPVLDCKDTHFFCIKKCFPTNFFIISSKSTCQHYKGPGYFGKRLTRLSLEGRLLIARAPSAYRSCPSSLLLVGRLLTTRDLRAYRSCAVRLLFVSNVYVFFEKILQYCHPKLEIPLFKALSVWW